MHGCWGEHGTESRRWPGSALRQAAPRAGHRLTAAVYRRGGRGPRGGVRGEGTTATVGAARTRRAFSGLSAPVGHLPAPAVSPGARGIEATGPGCHAGRADRLRSRPQGDASTAGPSAAGAPPRDATEGLTRRRLVVPRDPGRPRDAVHYTPTARGRELWGLRNVSVSEGQTHS